MGPWIALVVGGLWAAGIFLLLRRSLVKAVLGLALLGYATNLLLVAAAGTARRAAPIVPPGAGALPAGAADPVPQALVLTAIVIGLGVQAFVLVLLKRAHAETGSDDLDRLEGKDP